MGKSWNQLVVKLNFSKFSPWPLWISFDFDGTGIKDNTISMSRVTRVTVSLATVSITCFKGYFGSLVLFHLSLGAPVSVHTIPVKELIYLLKA